MAGQPSSAFVDGYRYFTAPVPTHGADEPGVINDVLLVVVSAAEELAAKHRAAQSERFAHALKRVGKVLTMNQGIDQICRAAAQEVASATELAAAMIWIATKEGKLKLQASVGITRSGVLEMESLDPRNGAGCVAELVASTSRKFFQRSVMNHVMTASLEANSCYLPPGGVCAYPLMAGGKLLGVVEIVGRDGDPHFEDHDELFETFAEHLSLAINAANMFETAERFASHDAMTEIANHRTMQQFLQRRMAEAQRNDNPIAVLMLDVDHFRSFNEEEGHDAGDRVLRLVAQTISENVRSHDLAARYGGEEFTVVMPGSDLEEAVSVAERIRKAIEATPFLGASGRSRHITISVGAAAFPETASEVPKLLKAADVALFQAKRAGRNQVQSFKGLYEGEMSSTTRSSLEIEECIKPEVFEATRKFQAWALPEIFALKGPLSLTENQISILTALVQIVLTYRLLQTTKDAETLRTMESSSEFRLLLPSLEALDERQDGKGPRQLRGLQIPLLARILQVLYASYMGHPLWDDTGRFDPEILGLHCANPEAA
jgi:diguanylate cyclase (GGDEF)-like protein